MVSDPVRQKLSHVQRLPKRPSVNELAAKMYYHDIEVLADGRLKLPSRAELIIAAQHKPSLSSELPHLYGHTCEIPVLAVMAMAKGIG